MQKLITLVALGAPALVGCVDDGQPEVTTAGFAVTIVPGGTGCVAQGLGTHEFRIEDPVDGVYAIDAGNTLLFRYYDDTNTVFFYTQSTLRMDGVIVHAGAESTVWTLPEANGWPSLGALDPVTRAYIDADAVSFCFDYELFLNPNGYAHDGSRQQWELAKTGHDAALVLADGDTFVADYSVTVTPTTLTPELLFVEGPVFVNNPTPYAPSIDAVTVLVGELEAEVTCPVALPHVLAPFSTLTCTFTVEVPDVSDRIIYVDVASDGSVAVDRSIETASFSSHTTTHEIVDECVTVYDDQVAGGVLGAACASAGPTTFTYSVELGPFACGPFAVTNTAWFEGDDTGATGEATWVIGGEVACDAGCTLTPGYWKTHSEHGPAPYDATWAQLPDGADTAFFLSGASYYDVLWTPPRGNAYYILSHAYIAARLNQLAGASIDDVASALAAATSLFETYAPGSSALRDRALRARFVALAELLDAYNNGVSGPGHCE